MAISAVLCGLAMFAMAFSTHVLQAALAFQALNIAANGVEASCRGLVMDVVPTSQQPGAWAAVSIALNIGSLAISLAGGLDLEKLLPGTLSQFQLITAFAVGSLFITVIMTCLTVGETPHEMEVEATKESAPSQEDEVEANTPLIGGLNRRRRTCMSLVGSTVSNALRSLVATPIPLVSLINKASFWGWGAASCISMFGTAWVQGFGSDPALGLRIASLASAAATVFSMAGNFILPAVATSFKIKLKSFWVLGNLTCVGLLAIGPAFVTGMHAAGGILAGTGLFWCTLIWVPFALLGELVSKSVSAEEVISGDEESREDRPALEYKAGESIGVLNFYQSLPQLLTIALSTVLLGSSGAEGAERSLGVALQMGAGMAGISAVYSAWIPENESID